MTYCLKLVVGPVFVVVFVVVLLLSLLKLVFAAFVFSCLLVPVPAFELFPFLLPANHSAIPLTTLNPEHSRNAFSKKLLRTILN